MFIKYFILFLAMAKFKQSCFAHDLSKKVSYFFSSWQSSNKLALLMTYRKRFILFLAMAKFKQACFAHDLSKKVQIFTAVHNSMC